MEIVRGSHRHPKAVLSRVQVDNTLVLACRVREGRRYLATNVARSGPWPGIEHPSGFVPGEKVRIGGRSDGATLGTSLRQNVLSERIVAERHAFGTNRSREVDDPLAGGCGESLLDS